MNQMQLRNSDSGRNSLPQETENRWVLQYAMINQENIHMSNSIEIQQVIFRNMKVYTHMSIIFIEAWNKISEKEDTIWMESKGIMDGFEDRKQKVEM